MEKILFLVNLFIFSATSFAMPCQDFLSRETLLAVAVRPLLASAPSQNGFHGEPVAIRLSPNGRFVGVLGIRDMYILELTASSLHLDFYTSVHLISDRVRDQLTKHHNSNVTLTSIVPNDTADDLAVHYQYVKGGQVVESSFTFQFRNL